MFGALRVGLTGLRANQHYLDVIGNNLTNSETVGFKSDRITFSDVLYQTSRLPTGPKGNIGGINGKQTGFGTQVGSVDQIHKQGTLIATGRNFDLALQGNGFFVVNDGNQDVYTRVGTFAIDRDGSLVDSRSGYRVQNVAGADIRIDTASAAPAQPTENITFAGNLPAKVSGPLAEVQESNTPFEDFQPAVITTTLNGSNTVNLANTSMDIKIGTAAPFTITFLSNDTALDATAAAARIQSLVDAQGVTPSITATVDASGALVLISQETGDTASLSTTGAAANILGIDGSSENGSEATAVATTELNDLSSNTKDYTNGDVILLTGIDAAGQTVNVSFTYGTDGTTLGDIVTKLSGAFSGTSFSIQNGRIHAENDATGDSELAIFITDSTTGTNGSTQWVGHGFNETVPGTDPDTANTSITVYDSLGIAHVLSGVFERQDDGTWNLSLSLPTGEGTISNTPIQQINFDSNGRFRSSASTQLNVTWANGATPQDVNIDFGSSGSLSGLTQFGSETSAQATGQDGYEAGALATIGVTQSGVIQGFYSNGAIIDLENIAVAVFQNVEGLLKEGSTTFRRSDNSGVPLIGQASVGGTGSIVSGSLEGSNVDTAEEFVRLIEAQRSFQGSARVVTTADQIFAELLQIVG